MGCFQFKMRRNSECEVQSSMKDQKPDVDKEKNQHENENNEPKPQIFQLNVDCLDKIFDYLPLEDLHSLVQTCRTMQQVAGQYFKVNFMTTQNVLREDGLFSLSENSDLEVKTNGFAEFMQGLLFLPPSRIDPRIDPFHQYSAYSLKLIHQLKSLNYLQVRELHPVQHIKKYFKNVLDQIEILVLDECYTTWKKNKYMTDLLQLCGNLKRLCIRYDNCTIITDHGSPWLLRSFPKLTHFEIETALCGQIVELRKFFISNPNVTRFKTNHGFLWPNRDVFFGSHIKLKYLEVTQREIDPFQREILNQLYDEGFYERLNLKVRKIDQQVFNELASIKGLEKLSIQSLKECCNLSSLVNIKKLSIHSIHSDHSPDLKMEIETLARAMKLEEVYLEHAEYEHFLTFVRYAPRMHTMKVKHVIPNNAAALNLPFLNKERQKLPAARKVIIYVGSDIFLKTKWATRNGDLNLNSVEIRRLESLRSDFFAHPTKRVQEEATRYL